MDLRDRRTERSKKTFVRWREEKSGMSSTVCRTKQALNKHVSGAYVGDGVLGS